MASDMSHNSYDSFALSDSVNRDGRPVALLLPAMLFMELRCSASNC